MKKTTTVSRIPPPPPPRIVTQVTEIQQAGRKKKNKRSQRPRSRGRSPPEYVSTLLEPDRVRGVSIPDTISMASGTYSYQAELQVTTDTSNGNSVVFFNPKMFIGNAGAATTAVGAGVLVNSNGAASGYGTNALPLVSGATNPDLSANVERFRVVSAEMQLYSAESPLNIKGRVCSFLLPSDYDMGSASSATSFPIISTLPNAITTHLIEGGRSVYLPGGPDDLLYASCANDYAPVHTHVITVATGAFHGTSGQVNSTTTYSSGPTLGIAVNGATGGISLNVRIVVNIQFLPESSNNFVTLAPVGPDPAAMSMANIVAAVPRQVLGYLNSHQEQVAGVLQGLGNYALRSVGRMAGSALVQASNALAVQRMPGLPGRGPLRRLQ